MVTTDSESRAWPPVRHDLQGQHAYGAPQINVPICLNTNENPFGPSVELAAEMGAAITAEAGALNRYPDRDAISLRIAISGYLRDESAAEVTANGVWPANGSNEVMAQLFSTFGGPERLVLTFAPTYSMYEQYARDSHTGFVVVPRQPDFTVTFDTIMKAIEEHSPDLVVLTSPNNPTGTALPIDVVDRVCASFVGLVIVDEAYAEFRRVGTPSALQLLATHPNLIVTRTMSKAFAFAGGRLGYAIADPAIIDAVQLVRLPYHLSRTSQVLAEVALAHRAELLGQVDVLRSERDHLVLWLRESGFTAVDSDANFILFGKFPDAHAVWKRLLAQGVLIREVALDGWLRVSIGTPSENEAFRQALLKATV